MLLLGHRGCRGEFMENTFAAFDYALESGCDGFELDVRRTADAIPIIWHDARLRGRFISRQLYSSLRERCSLIRRLPRRPVIDLCHLEEVLARYALVSWIDIELKVPGLETQVAALLRRYRPARGFVISSFRQRILSDIYRIDPTLPLAFIFDRMPRSRAWLELPIQYVKPSARLVTPSRVRQFHAEGKQVLTWTVNRPAMMRRLIEAGVDGMIGDDPLMLATTLARK
ncbi:MAG TPA: glycerophosphodiester phosphodiesterase [Candidatus Saccharimonadales bacterium]|nr:glycerophosphodiester phosphodiesterase [Candidatus Saccharimonadales bacterium]